MWPDKLIPVLVIGLVIVLIMFGPKQLPELGKSLGKTVKAIKDGVDGKDEDAEGKSDAEADKQPASKDAEG